MAKARGERIKRPSRGTAEPSGKRRRGGGGDGDNKVVEAFVERLAKALKGGEGTDDEGLKTVGDVREALASAVEALPPGKSIKSQLQDGLERYGLLLAKHLGVEEHQEEEGKEREGAEPRRKQKGAAAAKGKGKGKTGAAAPSRYALLLDGHFQRRLNQDDDLRSADRSTLSTFLLARAPASARLLRAFFGGSCEGGAAGVLEASVGLWGALPGTHGRGRLLAAALELSTDAVEEDGAASDPERLQRIRRALDRLFATLSARRWRQRVEEAEEDEEEEERDEEGELCGGDLVLMRAALLQAAASSSEEEGDAETRSSRGVVAGGISRDLAIAGAPAWLRVAEGLLEPTLPLKLPLGRVAEALVWQAAYEGLAASAGTVLKPAEAAAAAAAAAALVDPVRLYLVRILLSKRAAARRRGQQGAKAVAPLPQAPVGPPPPEFCAWLRTQPLNSAVSAAVEILDTQQPADLTAHLMRAEEKVSSLLLKSWRASAAQAAAAAAAEGEEEAGAEEGDGPEQEEAAGEMQDDGLFFMDTEGASQSHFGRSWAREEDEDEEEDEEDEDDSDDEDEHEEGGNDEDAEGESSEEEDDDDDDEGPEEVKRNAAS